MTTTTIIHRTINVVAVASIAFGALAGLGLGEHANAATKDVMATFEIQDLMSSHNQAETAGKRGNVEYEWHVEAGE
jgi:hypothetical protein